MSSFLSLKCIREHRPVLKSAFFASTIIIAGASISNTSGERLKIKSHIPLSPTASSTVKSSSENKLICRFNKGTAVLFEDLLLSPHTKREQDALRVRLPHILHQHVMMNKLLSIYSNYCLRSRPPGTIRQGLIAKVLFQRTF